MKKPQLDIKEQLAAENKAVHDLICFFEQDLDYSQTIYETWTAKDVLGHITSWHMSFERNLFSAVTGQKAVPFTGTLTEINEKEVLKMKAFTVKELIAKLENAQESICKNILNPDIKKIVYRKGSREYSPIEHLWLVQSHINQHLKEIRIKMP